MIPCIHSYLRQHQPSNAFACQQQSQYGFMCLCPQAHTYPLRTAWCRVVGIDRRPIRWLRVNNFIQHSILSICSNLCRHSGLPSWLLMLPKPPNLHPGTWAGNLWFINNDRPTVKLMYLEFQWVQMARRLNPKTWLTARSENLFQLTTSQKLNAAALPHHLSLF